jgi:hypothetical protein
MSTNSEDCALVPSTASAIKGSATNQPGPMSATDFIEAIRQGQTRDWKEGSS